ncbi:MAG: monovalent cation/H(+) antiporter subunit G [Litorilinea sp.]
MTVFEMIIIGLATVGTFFMVVSAVGIVRLPDVYTRMHAAGKATTLGISSLLLAAAVYFGQDEFWRMILLILLFLVTAPIAATSMARAAYRTDPERGKTLNYDEMARAEPPAGTIPEEADLYP